MITLKQPFPGIFINWENVSFFNLVKKDQQAILIEMHWMYKNAHCSRDFRIDNLREIQELFNKYDFIFLQGEVDYYINPRSVLFIEEKHSPGGGFVQVTIHFLDGSKLTLMIHHKSWSYAKSKFFE